MVARRRNEGRRRQGPRRVRRSGCRARRAMVPTLGSHAALAPAALDAATARAIRLVGIDVDGVLTDGGIYLGAVDGTPLEFKRYDIQDGLGIHFLRKAGIRVAIVTGRVSDSVRLRAAELEIEECAQDAYARKLPAFRRILTRHRIAPEETAFIGDDF